MKNTNFFKGIIISLAIAIGSPVFAKGDAVAGKEKALTCAGCHGAEGISAIPLQPNLAGQVPGYIANQLAMFKSDERKNAVMKGMSAGLSDEDMSDLDAYYSSLVPAARGKSVAADEVLTLGKNIYKGGIADRSIPSCISCHGKTGQGIPKHFPLVYGQHVEYLKAQLLSYKKGERKGYNEIMSSIAFKLSEKEIDAVSAYMNTFCTPPTTQQLDSGRFKDNDQACEERLSKK